MNGFGSVSLLWGGLVLLVAVALAFVLPPLLRRKVKSGAVDRQAVNVAIYRDQLQELDADLKSGELTADQYQSAKQEIEKRLSEDAPLHESTVEVAESGRWAGYAIAGMLPVLALGLYAVLGTPEAINLAHADSGSSHGSGAAVPQGEHDASAVIAALEAKLKANPKDSDGWYMLGRTYVALGRFDDAAQALGKASALLPDDARLLADYAEALALSQQRKFGEKAVELLNKALKINAKEEKALELLGIAAYQNREFAKAASYWRKLLKVIPQDSEYARDIAGAAEQAEKAAAGLAGKDAPSPQKTKPAAVGGTVTIQRELIGKVTPSDTVFIFAQAPGGKMPLASVKIEPGMLPYQFNLDDTLAMSPDRKISAHKEVVVTARISKSGQPTAQSGDLQGKSGPVKVGRQDLKVVIDTVLP